MRRSKPERAFDVLNILIMLFFMIVTIYPLWYVLCGSFSDGNILMRHSGVLLLPKGFDIAAYMAVFKNNQILSGFYNSAIILIGGTCLNLVMTSIGAYALSRKDLYWRSFIMKFIILTMYFSGGLVPTYLLIAKTLHMNDSLLALIIPVAISTHNLVIMRTSFADIPDSLIESAQLDGAKHAKILFSIVIPLSKAILAVMTLYYAVAHWNSWFTASIYLRSREKYPLQLVLREILIQNSTVSG
ncbi:MAG: carbohydrate ABC transporter permease, partial [Clostridia bacterium]|nr:carbohydrate ABC transporter permease [Clostridia bacterium]